MLHREQNGSRGVFRDEDIGDIAVEQILVSIRIRADILAVHDDKRQPSEDKHAGEIAKAVGIPLVLHGGSGLSEEAFRTAISHGICKVNIFTDINGAMAAGARQALKSGKAFGTDLILGEIEHIKRAAADKMKIFDCCGKAG